MTIERRRKLDEGTVYAAGLGDWRQLLERLEARFVTRNFAAGLEFVNRIGAAAEAADHHPDIVLGYSSVLVRLSSHDVGGITIRDIELARTISDLARTAGITADPAGLTLVELGLDTPDRAAVRPFWAALLGGSRIAEEVLDPYGEYPTIWFQRCEPGPEPVQRWHLDVWVARQEAPERIAAAVAAGGVLVDDAAAPSFWVLADPQGNRACVCTPQGRS